jgi:hypothetical protein
MDDSNVRPTPNTGNFPSAVEKKLTPNQIIYLAKTNGYEPSALRSVILTESSGNGFSDKTGRIIIQFEPSWFKRKFLDWANHQANHTWQNNGVGDQTQEWYAFNDAYSINANAAMESTSIGMMQVMGFHWKDLGFSNVGAMWDYAKISEANQVDLGIRFIKSIPKLNQSLKNKDWKTLAYYYNGAEYKKFNYDTRLKSNDNLSIRYFNRMTV